MGQVRLTADWYKLSFIGTDPWPFIDMLQQGRYSPQSWELAFFLGPFVSCTEKELIYKVVTVSAVQQSDSAIHIHVAIPFRISCGLLWFKQMVIKKKENPPLSPL